MRTRVSTNGRRVVCQHVVGAGRERPRNSAHAKRVTKESLCVCLHLSALLLRFLTVLIMSSDASSGVVDRVSSFISENKKVVLVGAALTVAAVGAGVYFASTSRGSGEPDAEKAERKKKKSKSSKKKKTVKDTDGPILEEVKPKVEEVPEGTWLSSCPSCPY